MEPGPTAFDPDLDSHVGPPGLSSSQPIAAFQRLIANPFLTVLVWLGAFGLVNESLHRRNLPLFFTGTILFFIAFLFLQFHCLDCGASGWLLRSRAHACPAVVARRQNNRFRRFRGPGIKLQLVLWLIIVTALFVVGVVAVGSSL